MLLLRPDIRLQFMGGQAKPITCSPPLVAPTNYIERQPATMIGLSGRMGDLLPNKSAIRGRVRQVLAASTQPIRLAIQFPGILL